MPIAFLLQNQLQRKIRRNFPRADFRRQIPSDELQPEAGIAQLARLEPHAHTAAGIAIQRYVQWIPTAHNFTQVHEDFAQIIDDRVLLVHFETANSFSVLKREFQVFSFEKNGHF